MNTKKLRFPAAGIAVLVSVLVTLYFFVDNLIRYFQYNADFVDFFELVGLYWTTQLIPPIILAVVLFTRTRNAFLPIAVLLQLFLLTDYITFFFIFNDINELLNVYYYPLRTFIGGTVHYGALALFVIYTFIFSLVCRKGDNPGRAKVMLIVWFIFYALYVGGFVAYIIIGSLSVRDIIEMVPYILSWIFVAFWIAFPYKNVKVQPQNGYNSDNAYQNPYYKAQNQQNQQYSNSQNQQYNNVQNRQYNPQPYSGYTYENQNNSVSAVSEAENSIETQPDAAAVTEATEAKYCENCHAPLEEGANFCGKCGHKCS